VINVLDKRYEIRDGTGVGVGAPQFRSAAGTVLRDFEIDLMSERRPDSNRPD